MKIGPATGTFLYIAQQHGHTAVGCDVSSAFIAYAQREYGVHIDHGRFEDQPYRDSQFDVVILFNVIENVPNQIDFFEAIHRTLKPGGRLVLNFVDMRRNLVAAWQRSNYFLYRPPVCYAYSSPVMSRVLNKFGFEIEEIYRDFRYMNLEKITTLLGNSAALRLARILHLERCSILLYAYPSKIVVARRRP